eukprot:CAMPEP_0177648094 /NCGR_PEP_ID=MMETSP0447-20121125/10648_1 /TAXON_ID=0 /ORGANISM="Stygamoeba regulata, Strain BSH-02190019" /LENGTH=83 /DNA_ID=CAMNT_0019150719 /DNA_START=60 /DNA_END=311 /DNA_ORIENTATION=+
MSGMGPGMLKASRALLGEAGHGHGHEYVKSNIAGKYNGVVIHPPKPWQRRAATFFGATTCLWLMWRCKEDGAVFLGLRHPWEH